ncbi:MAG: HAMP domain-containing sensor histidine kinase [Bacteroidia bacterium]|nr:HAMP domain-containing sensor histidine kinase [Bacteroidia bacterium]
MIAAIFAQTNKMLLLVGLALLCSMPIHSYANNGKQFYQIGSKYYFNTQNDSALIYLDKAVADFSDDTDYEYLIEVLLLRSRVLGQLTFFERALKDALTSMETSKKNKSDKLMIASLLSVGKVHYLMYNDTVAESYMLQAKALAEKKKLPKELMQATNALSQLYSVMERNEECFNLADKSLKMAQQQQDTAYIIQNLHLLAAYYINLNRWTNPIIETYQQKAKQYLDEAMQLAEYQNIPLLTLFTKLHLIRYYRVEKDYPKALTTAHEVIKLCEPSNYAILIQVYDHLVSIYAHLSDKENVINSHQQFHILMRKQSDYNLHQSLQEMRAKYQTEAKEDELTLRTQQLEMARLIYILSFVILFLLITVIIYLAVSRKKRKEQAEILKKLNDTKDRLFSIISHDLKAPAFAQKLAINGLARQVKFFDNKEIEATCNILQDNINEQVALIENMTNWASFQTDKIKFTPQLFDVIPLILNEIKLHNIAAKNKSLKFCDELPLSCIVFADKQMIGIVLRNLINNAIKFSNTGKEITVFCQCDRHQAIISVSDKGIGMCKQRINEFYTTGQKIETETGTHGEKGTGLGLALCKDLLDKHKSRLIIHSEECIGTTICFYLKTTQN